MAFAGNANTADLDPAVDKAGFGVAATFDGEFELEVLEAFLGADEAVAFYLFGGGAASDEAVFDPPHFGIKVPAVESLAIKEGDGFLGLGAKLGEGEKSDDEGHRAMNSAEVGHGSRRQRWPVSISIV